MKIGPPFLFIQLRIGFELSIDSVQSQAPKELESNRDIPKDSHHSLGHICIHFLSLPPSLGQSVKCQAGNSSLQTMPLLYTP